PLDPQEHEDLLVDLRHVLVPRVVLVRAREPQRECQDRSPCRPWICHFNTLLSDPRRGAAGRDVGAAWDDTRPGHLLGSAARTACGRTGRIPMELRNISNDDL